MRNGQGRSPFLVTNNEILYLKIVDIYLVHVNAHTCVYVSLDIYISTIEG